MPLPERPDRARDYERSRAPEVRTERGLFYTPNVLADGLVAAAIAQLIEYRLRLPFEQLEAFVRFEESDSAFAPSQAKAIYSVLNGMRILDPSCGAGALLLAAERAFLRMERKLQLPIRRQLLGTDIDEVAVALARSLLPKGARIDVANALDENGPKADVVVTNPPYGAGTSSEKDRDSYVSFWRAAVRRVEEQGVLALIVPTTWRTGVRYERARREVIEPSCVTRVLDVPKRSFADAYVDTCITLCLPKAHDSADRVLATSPIRPRFESTVSDLFHTSRGVLVKRGAPGDHRLFVGRSVAFAVSSDHEDFELVDRANIVEGERSIFAISRARLLVRRIIGRAGRLTAIHARQGDGYIVKKDFYVLVPKDDSLSLDAYAAFFHSHRIASILQSNEVAARKEDFAQFTLSSLRQLTVPRLDDHHEASAWLADRACEGEAIGCDVLASSRRETDSDPRWNDLRRRIDSFVEEMTK